jgi:plastocyanin
MVCLVVQMVCPVVQMVCLVVQMVCLVALPAAAEHRESAAGQSQGAPDVVEIVSTNVQGKNVFIPSTIVVGAGKPQTLSIFNTTDTPHGFAIDAAEIHAVLPAGEEHRVELPAMQPGIYPVHCQLHPPHRSARLLVVED